MTKRNEGARDVEPAVEVGEAAEAARRSPRTRVISEAVVAAIPAEGIPVEGEAEPGGGADDEDGG